LRSDVDKKLEELQFKVDEHQKTIDAAAKTYGEKMKDLHELSDKTEKN